MGKHLVFIDIHECDHQGQVNDKDLLQLKILSENQNLYQLSKLMKGGERVNAYGSIERSTKGRLSVTCDDFSIDQHVDTLPSFRPTISTIPINTTSIGAKTVTTLCQWLKRRGNCDKLDCPFRHTFLP